MDENSGLFFYSSGFSSIKLMKYKPLKLHNPVKIEEIKSILEQNINKAVSEMKKPVTSCKAIIRNIPSPKTRPAKIQSQRNHFYPKFSSQVSKSPCIFKELKPRTPSPYIRGFQARVCRKQGKTGNKLQVPQLQLDFDYRADLRLADSESASSSSRVGCIKNIYH